jgi:hypothetical protein
MPRISLFLYIFSFHHEVFVHLLSDFHDRVPFVQLLYVSKIDQRKFLTKTKLMVLPTKVESKNVESKKIERKMSKIKCRSIKMSKCKNVEV